MEDEDRDIPLPAATIRGLSYVRLVQEGLARGDVTPATLTSLAQPLRDATSRLLSAVPARGRFSTVSPTPAGKTDLVTFLSGQRADLGIVDDPLSGLKDFITANQLDRRANYSRDIDAHHWFVTELAREAVD